MKRLIIAGFAFGGLIAPAAAADMPLKAPPPPPAPVFTWNGCYLGAAAAAAPEPPSTTPMVTLSVCRKMPPTPNTQFAAW
jgi:hypothetical protein